MSPRQGPHRWSGWPGAYCLTCFEEDPIEEAIAKGDYDPGYPSEHGDVKPRWVCPPEVREAYEARLVCDDADVPDPWATDAQT